LLPIFLLITLLFTAHPAEASKEAPATETAPSQEEGVPSHDAVPPEEKGHPPPAPAHSEPGHPPEASPSQPHDQTKPHSAEATEKIFAVIPESLEQTFKPITDAYLSEDLEKAIARTKRLAKQGGEIGETAIFLLADLYLQQGGEKNPAAQARYFQTLEAGIRKYPKSENAARALGRLAAEHLKQKRYFAAMDAFKALNRHPQHVTTAQVGMVQVFHGLERWDLLREAYTRLSLLPTMHPSPEEQRMTKLLYADALFQQGRIEDSYQQYREVAEKTPDYYRVDPKALFFFSETSHRTGHRVESMALFATFYDLFGETPLDVRERWPFFPLALARFANNVRINGNEERLKKMIDIVYTMKPHTSGVREGKAIISTGRLAEMACPHPCSSEEVGKSLAHIEKEIGGIFLQAAPSSVTTQLAIRDWIIQLKRARHFKMAEEMHARLLATMPDSSPYRVPIEAMLSGIVFDHFDSLEDYREIIALYNKFRSKFTSEKMAGEHGFKIGVSYLKRGDFPEALKRLRPVAANTENLWSGEALLQMGLLLTRLGSYAEAQEALETYEIRYPKNRYLILTELGEVYYRQGEMDLARNVYLEWLPQNMESPQRKKVYRRLSDIYRGENDVVNQLLIYKAWIWGIDKESLHPYTELGDLYYEQGQYDNAIEYYQYALKFKKKPIDWIKLRLADSYRALGEQEKSQGMVQNIKKNAKDRLVKRVAFERGRDANAVKPVNKKEADKTEKKKKGNKP
jgi:tetratricopeptide (TPR) repeat protein